MNNKTKYTHIDLFSGIGGFSLGLKQAGFPISKTYFSEVDKYAISVYRKQFPKAEYIGAVEHVSGSRFKNRKTIITFGFPCQDLSVAGKRKGFDGSRSSLFFEAIRIIKESKADIFIFENVKGFYSSNNGKDFQIALQTIADLGLYECQWQLLNTAWFLPQNRERVYFVGYLGVGSISKVFPIRENNFRINEGNSEATKIRTLTCPGNSGGLHSNMTIIGQLRTIDGGGFRKMRNNKCPSLTARAREDGSGQPVIFSNSGLSRKYEKRKEIPPLRSHSGCGSDNFLVQPVLTPDRPTKRQNGRRFKEDGEKKLPCLRASSFEHNEFLKIDSSIRRLTPTECEKLQGFPDNWTEYGHKQQKISDTQRYKMCGNAVSVPVIKAISERLI